MTTDPIFGWQLSAERYFFLLESRLENHVQPHKALDLENLEPLNELLPFAGAVFLVDCLPSQNPATSEDLFRVQLSS